MLMQSMVKRHNAQYNPAGISLGEMGTMTGGKSYWQTQNEKSKFTPGDIFNQIVEENERKRKEEAEAERLAKVKEMNAKNNGAIHKLYTTTRSAPVTLSNPFKGGTSSPATVRSSPNVFSLRPGAGVNPGQSTYGFSSMQPSNAGRLYTIDNNGNKRYL